MSPAVGRGNQRIVGEEHRARLEKGQVVVAATAVSGHCREQPGSIEVRK